MIQNPCSSALQSATIGIAFLLQLATNPIAVAQGSSDIAIVAAQVRSQGFACNDPSSAERITADSFPDEAVYVVKCDGVTYFVRLIPDQAAKVSVIK